jgi:hypothetical protein
VQSGDRGRGRHDRRRGLVRIGAPSNWRTRYRAAAGVKVRGFERKSPDRDAWAALLCDKSWWLSDESGQAILRPGSSAGGNRTSHSEEEMAMVVPPAVSCEQLVGPAHGSLPPFGRQPIAHPAGRGPTILTPPTCWRASRIERHIDWPRTWSHLSAIDQISEAVDQNKGALSTPAPSWPA